MWPVRGEEAAMYYANIDGSTELVALDTHLTSDAQVLDGEFFDVALGAQTHIKVLM